jgi:periplasmic divalent cation tolerance protein
MVYITTRNKDEAKKIGRVLVKERLAACVNIFDHMESIYWWEGKMEEGKEAVLIAKTRQTKVKQLIRRVTALHSYVCPCIVALPVTHGHKPFLDWLEGETRL